MLDGEGGGSGSVTLGDNQSQNGDDNKGGSQNSSGAAGGIDLKTFVSALDGDNKAFVESKGWKDLNEIVKSHREAEKFISTRGAGQQKAEGGKEPVIPTSPEGYEFKLPEKFPDEKLYDKTLASKFSKWAHKAKLSTETAQQLHDMFVTDFADTFTASQATATEQFNSRVTQTFNDLTKEWGSEETPGFKRNLELSRRAISNLGPEVKAALKSHGIIVDNNGQEVVTNSAIIKAFAKVGATMYAEDAMYGAQTATENPFNPKTLNTTKAGELIKTNPELARTLINAAGPEAQRDWGWWLSKKK